MIMHDTRQKPKHTRRSKWNREEVQQNTVQRKPTVWSSIGPLLKPKLNFNQHHSDAAIVEHSRSSCRLNDTLEQSHKENAWQAQNSTVQLEGSDDVSAVAIHEAARQGIRTRSTSLPHAAAIQQSFGRHDISGIQYHDGPTAAQSARAMNAAAYSTAGHVVSAGSISMHTAAHEAAHYIQQQSGVQLKDNVGAIGDKYERHADAVANAVLQRKSAESLLDQYSTSPTNLPNTSKHKQFTAIQGPTNEAHLAENVQRKHVVQMYPPGGFEVSNHTSQRIFERGVSKEDVDATVKYGHKYYDPKEENKSFIFHNSKIGVAVCCSAWHGGIIKTAFRTPDPSPNWETKAQYDSGLQNTSISASSKKNPWGKK